MSRLSHFSRGATECGTREAGEPGIEVPEFVERAGV
jgi:hypothetical protein